MGHEVGRASGEGSPRGRAAMRASGAWRRATIWTAMFAAAVLCPVEGVGAARMDPPGEKGAEPAARRKVLHLKLKGDMDCSKVVADLREAMGRAAGEGVEVVVLEVCGDSWRGDVLLEAMDLVRGDRPRVVAWLNDPSDGRVGSGQAALGLMAAVCYAGPKTEVVFEGVNDLRASGPVGTDWEQVGRDVQARLWGGLRDRGREPLLAALLPRPAQPIWAVFDRPPAEAGARLERVTMIEPSITETLRSRALAVGAGGRDEVRLKIEAGHVCALGIAGGVAKDVGQILSAEHIVPTPLTRAEVVSGYPDARGKVERTLAAVDSARERVDKSLDEAEKLKGMDAARRRGKAGRAGVTMTDEALARLLDAEKLTQEYPELLRVAPPGATNVELTPFRLSAAWFAAFQARRESLAELRARAVRLAE